MTVRAQVLPRWSVPLAAVLLAAATLAAYANSGAGPFLFDDLPSIVRNPSIRDLGHWREVFHAPSGRGLTVEGRPFLNFSFALNYAWGGLAVGGYHAVNVGIHVLAALALFGIVRRTLVGRVGSADALALAWVSALLWALHPLQTESVTYVVQRAESLMGLFYLLTLYAFVRATAAATAGGGRGWLMASGLACWAGMATKEVMVSAPLIVLLYDRTWVAGSWREAWRRRRGYYLGLGSTWILLGVLVLGAGSRGGTMGSGVGIAWWEYGLAQFHALTHYLWLSVYPAPLVFDYGNVLPHRLGLILPPALGVLSLVSLTAWGVVRATAAGFLGAWFFAILAPTSSIVPGNRQTLAEHRMYLPVAAVLVGGALLLWRWGGRRALATLVAVALIFGVLTFRRNADYRSELVLFADTAAKVPGNPYALSNWGFALSQAGRAEEAVTQFQAAIRLAPNYFDAHYNLGTTLLKLGRPAEAVAQFQAALAINPADARAHDNLGGALVDLGRMGEAEPEFVWAVRQEPDNPRAHYNLGLARAARQDLAGAAEEYRTALRLRPDYLDAESNLGATLFQEGQPAEALAHYRHAVELQPNSADTQYNLGTALASLRQPGEAVAHYAAALRLRPGFTEAHLNLANALMSLRRPAEAAEEYRAALRLRPDLPQARTGLNLALRSLAK